MPTGPLLSEPHDRTTVPLPSLIVHTPVTGIHAVNRQGTPQSADDFPLPLTVTAAVVAVPAATTFQKPAMRME